ncbi:MAG TPA: sugar ABC transporter permease [Acholeplasma sp.]|nr:sugar ABC transporter permease [Acholeplasma sp.]
MNQNQTKKTFKERWNDYFARRRYYIALEEQKKQDKIQAKREKEMQKQLEKDAKAQARREKVTWYKKTKWAIQDFFYKLNNSKTVVKIKDALAYIPRKLTRNLTYRKKKSLWGFVFVIPLIIGFGYFFLIPFITTVFYSFSHIQTIGLNPITGDNMGVITENIGFDNYQFVWNQHSTFRQTLLTSFGNTLLEVPLVLIFSLILAVVLNTKFPGRSFVRAVFFMPVIFNSQAVEVAMTTGAALTSATEETTGAFFQGGFDFSMFLLEAGIPGGIVTFLGNVTSSIYDVITYSGVQILIFLSAIQSVPKHLYEAAKMEGATQYEIFWKITFPMVSPLMLTAGVYTVVDSFLRSDLLTTLEAYSVNKFVSLTDGLGMVTAHGIHAAMSWLFCLSSIILISLVLIVVSRMVFYYDE